MNKFWPLFWKLFGGALLVALVIGIIIGIAQGSPAIISSFGRALIAIGLGVSGIIGFLVVPIQLYFEDRASHKEKRSVIK
ncbi:MAG: hypothetical protein LBJ41_06345 [Treponema sp.]|jgi:small-conductance mechanosensitive channel|nr:hypothetical protein [Treponema sp.]